MSPTQALSNTGWVLSCCCGLSLCIADRSARLHTIKPLHVVAVAHSVPWIDWAHSHDFVCLTGFVTGTPAMWISHVGNTVENFYSWSSTWQGKGASPKCQSVWDRLSSATWLWLVDAQAKFQPACAGRCFMHAWCTRCLLTTAADRSHVNAGCISAPLQMLIVKLEATLVCWRCWLCNLSCLCIMFSIAAQLTSVWVDWHC